MDLGSLLRQKRKEKGFTCEQVGKIIGVSKNTISKYERNIIANMGNEKRLALAKLLDIPPIFFLEAIDKLESANCDFEEITPLEFKNEVIQRLHLVTNLSEQEKQLLITNIEFICADK